jgi:hypothetical protein
VVCEYRGGVFFLKPGPSGCLAFFFFFVNWNPFVKWIFFVSGSECGSGIELVIGDEP